MAVTIPIKDNPNHTILIALDSKIYKLYFLFNTGFEFWTMDIYTEDELLILSGVKIVANYPLIFSHINSELPSGDFICEISDTESRIVRNSFSTGKAKLLYLTKDELQTL